MFIGLWKAGHAFLVVSTVVIFISGIFSGLRSLTGGCFMDPGCRQNGSSLMYERFSLSFLFLFLVLFLFSCVVYYRDIKKNENISR